MKDNMNYVWRKTWGEYMPQAETPIIVLTQDARVMRGYMRATVWPGETNQTYSWHGEYYDFNRSKLTYCLVNALGWLPLPDVPEIQLQMDAERNKYFQGDIGLNQA